MKKAIKQALFLSFALCNFYIHTSEQAAQESQELPPVSSCNVRLISITPDAEKTMGYIARVSNPANQANEKVAGLLRYCIKNHHWSVFEQAFMTLEIECPRIIGEQILRHRSFSFQVFSHRYADVSLICEDIPMPDLRSQDYTNRQNSIDDLTEEQKAYWHEKINHIYKQTMVLYLQMLEAGIAKECARFILPTNIPSRMYMSGSIRSWIHYIELRSGNGTQKEHMEVANKCKEVFIEQLPTIAKALDWIE